MPDVSPLTPDPSRPVVPARLAARLARAPHLWSGLVVHRPGARLYAAVPGVEGAEAWVISWAPGTRLDLHDHGGVRGAMALVEGTLVERHGTRPLPAPLRTRVIGAGAVVAFGADHVHSIENLGVIPATSLHVYAPALEQMTFYGPDPRDDRLVDDQPRRRQRVGSEP
jgi:hypothetical protein